MCCRHTYCSHTHVHKTHTHMQTLNDCVCVWWVVSRLMERWNLELSPECDILIIRSLLIICRHFAPVVHLLNICYCIYFPSGSRDGSLATHNEQRCDSGPSGICSLSLRLSNTAVVCTQGCLFVLISVYVSTCVLDCV